MKAHDVVRSRDERRNSLRRTAMLFCALAVAGACTGENLFTGPALGGGGGLGPEVEITEPTADAALNVGDSVRVVASIASETGVNQVVFSGTFETGVDAYIQESVSLSGATDTILTNFLRSAGTATGAAKIIVQATDLLGTAGADTVSITVN